MFLLMRAASGDEKKHVLFFNFLVVKIKGKLRRQ